MQYVMRYHEKLVNSKRNKRIGNHSVIVLEYLKERDFYYHGNCVCEVFEEDKTFRLNDCGWGGSRSTKICLAGYRTLLTSMGYKQTNPQPIFNYEYKNKM